jgi:MFS family permease
VRSHPRRVAGGRRGLGEGPLTTDPATSAKDSSVWQRDIRPISIGIVALITLVAFEAIGTATAMPVVATDLDALGGYTWAFNSYIVASLFAMVLGGLWSDATGPRGPLIAGVASLSGGAVIAGAAFNLGSLVVGRALQGFGGGLIIVAVYVLIARAYPVDLRPKAFSVLAAAWVVPSLVGPVIAGWLSDAVTWRAVFWLVPVFVIPPAILLFPRLSAHQWGTPHASTRRRLIAGVVATLALLAFQDGVLRLSALGAVEAGLGLILLVASVRHLLPPGALVFRRGLPTSVMMRGVIASAFFSAEVFVPLALIETRDLTTTQAGLVLATAAGMWATGSYVQSRLPGDSDRSMAVRTGAAIVTLCLLTLPLSVLTDLPPWIAAVSWAIGAFGMGLAIPSVSVQVMRLSPEPALGVNSAAIQIVDSVLSVVVIALLGVGHAVAVNGGGATATTYALLWLAAACVSGAGIALAGRMRPSLSV